MCTLSSSLLLCRHPLLIEIIKTIDKGNENSVSFVAVRNTFSWPFRFPSSSSQVVCFVIFFARYFTPGSIKNMKQRNFLDNIYHCVGKLWFCLLAAGISYNMIVYIIFSLILSRVSFYYYFSPTKKKVYLMNSCFSIRWSKNGFFYLGFT